MTLVILLFLAGLFLLCKGGDLSVDGAAFFARKFRISEIIIGTTILSIGTTLPEITVSSLAAAGGSPMISYGNAIGSVICNTALIGGILCLLAPSMVRRREIGASVFFFCSAAVIAFGSSFIEGYIGTVTGIALILVYAASVLFTISGLKNKNFTLEGGSCADTKGSSLKQGALLCLGLVMILAGSRLLIDNGIRIAEALHVPAKVIAFTFIALGTSLPELVTAVIAIYRKHAGLSLGNLIGANLMNLTMVLGISGIISPIPMPFDSVAVDLFFICLFSALLILPVFQRKKTFRVQGVLMLLLYLYYCIRLFSESPISVWLPYIAGR